MPETDGLQLSGKAVMQVLQAVGCDLIVLQSVESHGQMPAESVVELIGRMIERSNEIGQRVVAVTVELDQMVTSVKDLFLTSSLFHHGASLEFNLRVHTATAAECPKLPIKHTR